MVKIGRWEWISICALVALSSTAWAQPSAPMRHHSRSDIRHNVRQRPYTPTIPSHYGYQSSTPVAPKPATVPAKTPSVSVSAAPKVVAQPSKPSPAVQPSYAPKLPTTPPPPKVASEAGWQEFIPSHVRDVRHHPVIQGNLWTGYRVDELDWNIAGNLGGANPNILSELTWRKLQMYEFGGTLNYTHPEGLLKNIHVDSMLVYATTFAGENQDSDFNQDNRQGEFSRSYADADDGQATSIKFAAGYVIDLSPSHASDGGFVAEGATKIWLTPMLGYARQTLDVTMSNGVLVIPEQRTFDGLASTYDTRWDGAFVALKAAAHMGRHRIAGRGEYHLADYEAGAQWNLRQDFNQPLSFVHTGDAVGLEFGLDYSYMIYDHWGLNAGFGLKDWSVENGHDLTIFRDGIVLATRLNEVNWTSYSYRLGMNYLF
ncbi:MAG: hypothetical protein EAZ74_00990 [Alphaproteobacteria bacterium]|nr:MAG: hypothetical protein EAZ74_00990 [Alphaproteobacteria bacterium]TAF75300.1 MAG: hypothetical protein EAZ52_07055 [Alphaproteobacteria bacterium]